MTSVYIIFRHIFIVSSSRNKTNPYLRNKFIPVLIATLLQAFKPKLLTSDQLLKSDQQEFCMHKLKHFQPHSHLCHLWCISIVRFDVIFLYDSIKSCRSSFDKHFFFIIYNLYHIDNQLYKVSCTSRTITSSQYHPRETRPLLGQWNLYKKTYIVFADFEFESYIARNASMFLLIRFFTFSYFFVLSFNFIYNMKLNQSICLFVFLYSAISFPFLHFHI